MNRATPKPDPSRVTLVRRAATSPDAIAPDGSEIRQLVGDDDGVSRASLCEVTLPAGRVTRPVRHRTVEEIWYVVEGTGKVWRRPIGAALDDCPPMDVGPGDALTIPTGWEFQFSSSPTGDLRFLCFTSPPWPGETEAVVLPEGGLGQPTV